MKSGFKTLRILVLAAVGLVYPVQSHALVLYTADGGSGGSTVTSITLSTSTDPLPVQSTAPKSDSALPSGAGSGATPLVPGVPEPSTTALLMVPLGLLALYQFRKSRRTA